MSTTKSKKVYTSGVSLTDLADEPKPPSGADGGLSRANQLNSVSPSLPSQKYTYQRGLAKAALNLPEKERVMALAEALAAMGLLDRIMPRREG